MCRSGASAPRCIGTAVGCGGCTAIIPAAPPSAAPSLAEAGSDTVIIAAPYRCGVTAGRSCCCATGGGSGALLALEAAVVASRLLLLSTAEEEEEEEAVVLGGSSGAFTRLVVLIASVKIPGPVSSSVYVGSAGLRSVGALNLTTIASSVARIVPAADAQCSGMPCSEKKESEVGGSGTCIGHGV